MAYTINKFSGEPLIVLEDGTIDTSTSLGLVGRNYVGYGETQNENFVFLLENFANDAPPARPLQGQIWFNKTDKSAYVYDGAKWSLIGSAVLGSTAPANPNVGSFWLRTPVNTLNVWDGTQWRFIGPEAVPGFGTTRARSGTLLDSNNVTRPVIFLEINATIIAVCTDSAFTINPSNSIPNLSNSLIAGINLTNNFRINGNITGNAGSATKLETARTINGIPFDGQQNINIKSSTSNRLIRGTYLTGSNFDGSAESTWSVDATPSNVIGKVVARNSEGGFSAGTITATFIGDLTGDVNSSGTSEFNIVRANQFIGATLSGNAFSASQLETPRRINGVLFDATQDITVTAAAETLTGNTLASNVTTSSLTRVGTLIELLVNDTGVSVGAGGQLRVLVDAGIPTLRSTTGQLNFDIGSSGPDISFVNAATSVLFGGPNAPAIIGDNTTNLGINGYKFNNVYANNFLGNATSATTSVTATNIAGGGLGSIPVQTAVNTTGFLNLGNDGFVLRSRPSGPNWEALSFEQLNKGSYLNFVNTVTSGAVSFYNSSSPVTISVDATTTNTASKIVARDASGNFAAGTITANLNGTATNATNAVASQTATRLFTPRKINGVDFDGTADITVSDPNSGTPVGAILYYPSTNIPVGWLVCNGSLQSTSAFPLLFSKIGYNFGGSGSQFRLPDLRGEFVRGADLGRGVDVGRSVGSFQDESLRSHTHTYVEWYGNNDIDGPDSVTVRSGDITTRVGTTSATGGTETRPRNISLVPCIKAFGTIDDPDQLTASGVVASIANIPRYQITSGNAISAVGFSNVVGVFVDSTNYFDVFPPSGKTMGNLVAFIPSIANIFFNGGVNNDDSMRCTWTAFGDRIRVFVQNTEQRATPRANYIAIWS